MTHYTDQVREHPQSHPPSLGFFGIDGSWLCSNRQPLHDLFVVAQGSPGCSPTVPRREDEWGTASLLSRPGQTSRSLIMATAKKKTSANGEALPAKIRVVVRVRPKLGFEAHHSTNILRLPLGWQRGWWCGGGRGGCQRRFHPVSLHLLGLCISLVLPPLTAFRPCVFHRTEPGVVRMEGGNSNGTGKVRDFARLATCIYPHASTSD
jgi:hypothetical protein